MRVTVPLDMRLSHGTRMLIDQGQPAQSPYIICFPVGCLVDYQVTDDLIAKMKKGQNIVVQAINMQGTPVSLSLPLNDFAKAYDGPPTDPKVLEVQQQNIKGELERRAAVSGKKNDPTPNVLPVNSSDLANLTYSRWVKVCSKGPNTDNKKLCIINKEARLTSEIAVHGAGVRAGGRSETVACHRSARDADLARYAPAA